MSTNTDFRNAESEHMNDLRQLLDTFELYLVTLFWAHCHPLLLEVGPVFFSVTFSWGLFGVFLLQIYIYTVWYRHMDRKSLQYIVYLLLLLEVIQTVMVTHTGWEILAFRWGDPTVLVNVPWSASAIPINTGVVAMIIELYFCWRIRLLGGSSFAARVISVFCSLLSVIQCSIAISIGVKFIVQNQNVAWLMTTQSKTLTIVWLILTTACDTLISGSLIHILLVAKSHSLAPTGSLLNRLIIQTIQSGAITALFVIFHLSFYLVFYRTLVHIPFLYILGRLYANVLLSTLNNRNRVNKGGHIISQGITFPDDWDAQRATAPPGSGSGTKIGLIPDSGDMEMNISTVIHIEDESKKDLSLSNV